MDLDMKNKTGDGISVFLYRLSTKVLIIEDFNLIVDICDNLKDSIRYCNPEYFYPYIFSILIDIKNNDKYSLNTLNQNLKNIIDKYEPVNNDVNKDINSLFNYMNLEISRILYYGNLEYKLSQINNITEIENKLENIVKDVNNSYISLEEKINKFNVNSKILNNQFSCYNDDIKIISDKIAGFKETLGNIETEYNNIKSEIKSQQKEFISILGIFSAVVLTFNLGSLSYSAIFNNILNTNTLKMMIVSLELGLVLVNILFFLFYFIAKIIDKKISWKYYAISNLIMIAFITIFLFLYYVGWINFMKI